MIKLTFSYFICTFVKIVLMKRKALGAIDRIDRLNCKTVGERDS